jgi:hypothetical protein
MNKNLLFAIDSNTEEVIVSNSPKGSNKVNFIERIGRNDNERLYHAVEALTSLAKAPDFDAVAFKKKDKECQILYDKHKK